MSLIQLGLIVYILLAFHMALYWFWYLKTRNPGVIDVGWATALVLAGTTSLILRFGSSLPKLPLVLLLAWGARLGGYLWYTRIRKALLEKRYVELSQHWKQSKALGFFFHYQLQGLLAFLVAMPWFFIDVQRPLWLDIAASSLVLLGIFGESLADWQLYHFRKNPSPARVCDVGLWQYSRHPNYFFEWLVWCGFATFALNVPFGAFTLVSPIVLYGIMAHVTGPITEQSSLASRGTAYRDYQQRTPMFFPKIRT